MDEGDARSCCRELGTLFVADEVITAFGRTGPLFACEEDDIVPDFITTAKGLTSGYVPMGAVFMADHVYQTRSRMGPVLQPSATAIPIRPIPYPRLSASKF